MKFNELEISNKILRAVSDMGFDDTTDIQAESIKPVLEGMDVVGQAQTGTGKTAAFGIPILEKIDPSNKKVQALILCPTRELAMQISEELHKLAKYMHDVKILAVYGGQEIYKQIKPLHAGVQIVVGTPGRVMDHMRRKTLKLDNLNIIALDEADEMLNMGFREDIETILADVKEEHQTVMFSATMPQAIMDITRNYMNDPLIIRVAKKELTVNNINQKYYLLRPGTKEEALSRLLNAYHPTHSMIFCNTKKQVDELCTFLRKNGYHADGLHGDMKQQQRDHVMNQFRSGIVTILVATDVAARGIDVSDIDAVFNYDLPQDCEYYVHRIGRTGRAGKSGDAYSLVTRRDMNQLRNIQNYCRIKIKADKLPTKEEIDKTKIDQFFEKIDQVLSDEYIEKVLPTIQEKINEYEDPAKALAALFYLSNGETADYLDDIEDNLENRSQRNMRGDGRERRAVDRNRRGMDRSGGKGTEREGRGKRKTEEGMTRLFVSVGKRDKVRPQDLVGAIAGESKISGRNIGAIEICENFSFVEVPKDTVPTILTTFSNKKKIRGHEVFIEKAKSK